MAGAVSIPGVNAWATENDELGTIRQCHYWEIFMNETIRAFVDCINAHDVDGLTALMADEHVFIDAHGDQVRGKETMTAGWRGYFGWFPDYYIEITDVFENGELFAMCGFAGGSFKGKADASWRLPAAWKAIVKDGRVALWQVFADTKIPLEMMEK